MSVENNNKINKDNIEKYLNEFVNVFIKLNGRKMPAEIVLVGGASVLLNYKFRESTGDIDAIIISSSVAKEAARVIEDKYGLPSDWLNTDFIKTKSYSSKLREVSVFYKTYSDIVEIRTIKAENLIAMKLMAGRTYKNDLSDIVGILGEHEKIGKPIQYEDINNAVVNIYNKWDNLPKESISFIEDVFKRKEYNKMYDIIKIDEKKNKEMLVKFNEENPKIITKDNIKEILKKIKNNNKL